VAARIAEYLGVSAVSVSRALTRLEKRGDLLQRTPEVRLTEQGWKRAEAVVRRHRLAERWLADRLGLNLVEAHREAERLEHALSDRVEEALWEDLGRPGTCPHGNPIPGLGSYSPPLVPLIALDAAGPGTYVVERIFEQLEGLEERLTWIEEAGLVPGATLEVLTPFVSNMPTYPVLRGDGLPLEVPASIASRLLVRPLADNERPHKTATTV
jgi:DtxR family Mn-dependent transcriptional regulator